MSCGPHTTPRQVTANKRRNLHVASVSRQIVTRRQGTTVASLTESLRRAQRELRAAEMARPVPSRTKPGRIRPNTPPSAKTKAQLTAHNTASKHARATARASEEVKLIARELAVVKKAASARAKETARQHFIADRTSCHQNTRGGTVLRVPRGPYKPAAIPSFATLGSFKGQSFRPSRPVRAAKAARAAKATRALRAR